MVPNSLCGHLGKSLKVDQLTRGLSFSGLPFPFHKHLMQRVGCFLWAMTKILALSWPNTCQLWLLLISVYTTLQCEFKHEDLYRAKRKLHWNRPQELFCLSELVVSSNPWAKPETGKNAIFLEELLEKVTFCHFEETVNLILDELTLSWHWSGLSRGLQDGALCHLHWHTMYNCYNCQWLHQANKF